MKRTVTFAIAALMALTLVGCSSSKKEEGVDVEKDAAAEGEGTEWVDTIYEEKATEDASEKIADDEQEISELEAIIEEFESESAYSAEDIEKLESNAEEDILELQTEVAILESEEG